MFSRWTLGRQFLVGLFLITTFIVAFIVLMRWGMQNVTRSSALVRAL